MACFVHRYILTSNLSASGASSEKVNATGWSSRWDGAIAEAGACLRGVASSLVLVSISLSWLLESWARLRIRSFHDWPRKKGLTGMPSVLLGRMQRPGVAPYPIPRKS